MLAPRVAQFASCPVRRYIASPGIHKMFSTPSQGKDIIEAGESRGGRVRAQAKLPGLNTLAGRILKTEADVATTNRLCERTDSYLKWMIAFGVGTVLVGIGSAVFKVYYYDMAQEERMKTYVKETVEGTAKLIVSPVQAEMVVMKSDIKGIKSDIKNMKSDILSEIRAMGARR